MTSFSIDTEGGVSNKVLDPGYTPPINTSYLPGPVGIVTGLLSGSGEFHCGESSAVSSITPNRLHPNTTLSGISGFRVVASALIKFRAGPETNKIGLEKANSPYHVPWVWCEHALLTDGRRAILIANGSQFPSHAWYVNGQQVGILIQNEVELSEAEPALAMGVSADKTQPDSSTDESIGPVSRHANTLPQKQTEQITLNVSA